MEPSSAEDGDLARKVNLERQLAASMEPSSAEDGDNEGDARPWPVDTASMEPSSAEDGDLKSRPLACGHAPLQWSRPQLRTETAKA